ncbi:hypothetical protein R1sor_018557 [Riccia sorocarpa]|uniref:Mediator of RNA polymerase II transcription subunit 13 n=1 Tax=Riccia sorocarpa TaxID=122646 RepID=A0ABD3IDQ9_9MARC
MCDRKVLPTCELLFMGSDEALFVHVVVRRKCVFDTKSLMICALWKFDNRFTRFEVSACVVALQVWFLIIWLKLACSIRRRVRLLAAQDMLFALAQRQRNNHVPAENSLTVAPYGLSGRLTGCCPGNLVSVLYRSKLQAFTASSLPFRLVSSSASNNNGATAVQSCYAEVWVGQLEGKVEQSGGASLKPAGAGTTPGNVVPALDQAREADDDGQVQVTEDVKPYGKVLIYPTEAVLAPVLPPVPSRTYLRRCWLQEWAGTHWLEDSAVPGLNLKGSDYAQGRDKAQTSGGEAESSSTSSSSSGDGSMKSSGSREGSGSSSSSESEVSTGEGELEADADSFGTKGGNASGGVSLKRSSGASGRNSAHNEDAVRVNSGSKRNRGTVFGLSGEPSPKVGKVSTSPGGELSALLDVGSSAVGRRTSGNTGEVNVQGSLGMGVGTPREGGSQAGTPWDWADEGMGLGMSMGMEMQTDADILAEFGDFGDFFEDDVLGFGEPPGTAESQAMMFNLGEAVEGVNTPGTISMDSSDPMLLPILDFPTLEGFGGQPLLPVKEQNARGMKVSSSESIQEHGTGQLSPPVTTPAAVDMLAKAESLLLFPPSYARVELPVVKDEVAFSSTYLPESRKMASQTTTRDVYVYSATPPPLHVTVEVPKAKPDQVSDAVGDDKTLLEPMRIAGKLAPNLTSSSGESLLSNNLRFLSQRLSDSGQGHGGAALQEPSAQDSSENDARMLSKFDIRISAPPNSTTPVLATELECALLQASMLCASDYSSVSSSAFRGDGSPSSSIPKLSAGVKDGNSDFSQNHGDQMSRILSKPPLVQKKKSLPSRFTGDDEDLQDGLRAAQVGVWRPVQAPRPQKTGSSMVDSLTGLTSASPDTGNFGQDGSVDAAHRLSNWQSVIEAIPLLAQQAAVSFDIALDGECGDGPLGWLAFLEQQRHQCGCGPEINHIACGGMFSIRHFVDNAGLEYIDPLAAEIAPASVANLLQSDFRLAISSAFGEANTEGPLTGLDWCRGRLQGDCRSGTVDSKDGMSGITMATDQSRGDDQRRSLDDAGTSDSELQPSVSGHGSTLVALPIPALLVGYQEDWLKTSPNVLPLWEKAPLEPYASPKPVSYYVLCLGLDSLVTGASDFFQQLSSVYETCKLGSHLPASTPSPAGSISGFSKQVLPGFLIVDSPCLSDNPVTAPNLIGDFVARMDNGWNFSEFRKSLSRVCRAIPVTANLSSSQRDPDQGQSVVVYVISPSSEPAELLQIILDVSQYFGSALSEKELKSSAFSQTGAVGSEEVSISPVVGFSTSRFIIQVLPAEVILKVSNSLSSELSTLREVAFGVYNKARRVQRKVTLPESLHSTQSASRVRSGILQSGPAMPGLWKDCTTVRNNAVNMGLESSLRSSWDGGWQSTASRFGDSSVTDGGSVVGESSNNEAARFLYEPLFILAEPGIPDPNANCLSLRSVGTDGSRSTAEEATGSSSGLSAGISEAASGLEGADGESQGGGSQQAADLHCCYAWTEDWQWLVSVWTDARGELLDVYVLPLIGAVKEAGLQNFFTQVLQQGLQLLTMAVEAGSQRPRNIVICRLGDFTERECQDWYRTVMSIGGDESRRWPLQLWPGTSNTSQSQDFPYLSDRTLGLANSTSMPPSPTPPSSYTSRNKSSGLGMNVPRRQGQGLSMNSSLAAVDSKGSFQWVNSISLASVRVEHALQAVCVSDLTPSSAGGGQGSSSASTWPGGSSAVSNSTTVTGISPVKSLSNMGASYLLMPSSSPRFLSPISLPSPLASSNLSPVAQLLQGSPLVSSVASAYVISPPTLSPMSEFVQQAIKEESPSTLHVALVALSGNPVSLDCCSVTSSFSHNKSLNKDSSLTEAHRTLLSVASQVHALSWLNLRPSLMLRQSPLPFHCHVAQRLRRLLSYFDVDYVSRHHHTPV